MTSEEFEAFAQQGYNHIPVYRRVLADLDTPLSAYLKLANGPYSYLFESVLGGEKWGRYSFIGLPCSTVLKVRGLKVTIETDGKLIEEHTVENPLDFIEDFQTRYRVPEMANLPRFNGGLVGYFGHETVRYIEPALAKASEKHPTTESDIPDIVLMVSQDLVVFDTLRGTLYVMTHVDPTENDAYQQAQQRLDDLVKTIQQPRQSQLDNTATSTIAESDFRSGTSKEEFSNSIEKIKDYVLAGDTMQVVLSRLMSIDFPYEPLSLYRALRCLNPSPYMYALNFDDFHVVGSSPEILARYEAGRVTVKPIAGTRRRGRCEADDLAMEQDMLNDPKEIAEHLMLIDLGRNDIGRVCEIGSVQLTEKMNVERYSHVMHIVSTVEGTAKPGTSPLDVLKATFPAGTLSGAPKIRALEIIAELEPTKRGIYGGAVGYLSWHGDMDTAIAIRTAVIKDGELQVQVGAGVVADSDPNLEWKETANKGRAIFQAAQMVASGLMPPEEN